MLRRVPAYQEIPATEILFERVPACAGACLGAGTTMARAADRIGAAPHLSDVAKVPGWCGSFRRSSGHIDARTAVSVGSTGPQEEEGTKRAVLWFLRSLFFLGVHFRDRSCCVGAQRVCSICRAHRSAITTDAIDCISRKRNVPWHGFSIAMASRPRSWCAILRGTTN